MAEIVARTLRRTPRWLRSLPVSLALHVAIAAVVLAVMRSDQAPPALIVDLTAVIAQTEDGAGARGAASPAGNERSSRGSSAAKGAHATRPAPAPAPRVEAPRAAARAAAPPPSVPPPAPAAVPRAPADAVPPPTAEGLSRSPVTPPPATSPTAPTASVPETSSPAGTGMPVPSGASSAPGATAGTSPSSAGVGNARGAGGGGRSDGPGVASAGGDRFALVVPGTGTGGGLGSEYGAYLALLRQRVQQSLRYPAPARRRGIAGTVQLEIAIKSDGAIASVAVIASSSHDVLDRAAVEAARALSRQPFPADVRPRPLKVRLPVVFELQ